MRCLVVEDDPDIQADIRRALEASGFVVDVAGDGEAAWYGGDTGDYDAAVLDLGLPRLDGLSVLRRWRAAGRAFPVIVVSARGDWTEKVEGIEAGADDYLAKPFEMGELVARVRALVRRAGAATARAGHAVERFCGLHVDADSGAVCLHDVPMELTIRELALLRALLARPGHAVAKERLFELVFAGESDVQPEAIEVVAYRLRKKLAHTGAQLVTLRGLGYLLKAAAE